MYLSAYICICLKIWFSSNSKTFLDFQEIQGQKVIAQGIQGQGPVTCLI